LASPPFFPFSQGFFLLIGKGSPFSFPIQKERKRHFSCSSFSSPACISPYSLDFTNNKGLLLSLLLFFFFFFSPKERRYAIPAIFFSSSLPRRPSPHKKKKEWIRLSFPSLQRKVMPLSPLPPALTAAPEERPSVSAPSFRLFLSLLTFLSAHWGKRRVIPSFLLSFHHKKGSGTCHVGAFFFFSPLANRGKEKHPSSFFFFSKR